MPVHLATSDNNQLPLMSDTHESTMSLSSDEYRTIDQIRQKLFQLSSSIQSVKVDLERNEPLPKPEALASSAHILNYSLTQFNQIFAQHRQFLNAAHAYPLPNFPGTTQEVLLGQLVKKKLEPRAQDWVDEYSQATFGEEDAKKPFRHEQMRQLWDWAGPSSSDVVRELITNDAFEDDYTFAEREAGIENVVTGLKRTLGDDSDEDDEDGDKMDEDVGVEVEKSAEPGIDTKMPPMPLDRILAFTMTGALPPGFK
ncbi:mediator complex, subunit Med8 [Acrodontium crateriforme]|uniref:Mediator of RNA polymerase II transcription subunit 8 n=1 Tax=Acrodontium crateriforme TaxID=150365 RepID=A0AAQ3RD32_9PEZI|nr:mediator complex, subunit Med8 [Acrodontium crateriforme]